MRRIELRGRGQLIRPSTLKYENNSTFILISPAISRGLLHMYVLN